MVFFNKISYSYYSPLSHLIVEISWVSRLECSAPGPSRDQYHWFKPQPDILHFNSKVYSVQYELALLFHLTYLSSIWIFLANNDLKSSAVMFSFWIYMNLMDVKFHKDNFKLRPWEEIERGDKQTRARKYNGPWFYIPTYPKKHLFLWHSFQTLL